MDQIIKNDSIGSGYATNINYILNKIINHDQQCSHISSISYFLKTPAFKNV